MTGGAAERATGGDELRGAGRAAFILRHSALVVFLLALAVRLFAATAYYEPQPSADAADYHRLAAGVAGGAGYVNEAGSPTAWRPPGYPFFLAAVYAVFGPDVRAATLAQAVLGALTAVLLAIFAGQVAGRREALLAGLLAAVYPGFFWLPRLLLSENLALFLVAAGLCVAASLARRWRAWQVVALGVLLGVGTLTRGPHVLFAMLLLAWLAWHLWRRGREWRRALLTVVLACAGAAAVVAPWAARNQGVFGRRVLVATQDGMGLYASFYPPTKDGRPVWGRLPGTEDPFVAEAERAGGGEAAVSESLRRATFRRLAADPARFLRVVPSKLLSLAAPFDWETFPHAPGASRSLNPVYALVLIPAMLGVLVLRRRRAPLRSVLWVVPLAVLAQALITYGSPRFRLTAETSSIVWASAAAVWAWDRRTRRPSNDKGRVDV